MELVINYSNGVLVMLDWRSMPLEEFVTKHLVGRTIEKTSIVLTTKEREHFHLHGTFPNKNEQTIFNVDNYGYIYTTLKSKNMINREDLATLHQQVKKVAIAKGGYYEKEYNYAIIFADGSLAAECTVGGHGYYETETYEVKSEDLEKSEELLKEERQIEIEEKKRKAEILIAEAKIKLLKETEENDKAEFERLKQKFGV